MNKPSKVLLLGSGALKIGEAGEFDYSGSQALKALREEGITSILINPNIATVQTSEGIADKIYYLPVSPDFVERVIEKEHPDGILLAFGGQTALNCGIALHSSGILRKHGVQVLGTPAQTIIDTEDREIFARRLAEINIRTTRGIPATNIDQAIDAARQIGFPLIIRAAYTLGGLGSGFCANLDELRRLATSAFSYSPQILIEESLQGWKEIEYEVVRDRHDNCITVCNMENFDPLGIHTGESIVVAPSQTLTNDEYHHLRSTAIRLVRHLGIIGECNVQYALDPCSGDYRVIEVNARLSRSSALASKATGYPLALVATKLALGHGLHQIKNNVTCVTTACFEPALDYVVCKIPRWDLNKFQGVSHLLGSSMKSVGEIMAIGRTFEEAIQKGIRMLGQGIHGFDAGTVPTPDIDHALSHPTDTRLLAIANAFRAGYTVDRIHALTRIDPWFLQRLHNIHLLALELSTLPQTNEPTISSSISTDLLLRAKQHGFSDLQIARLLFPHTTLPPHEQMLCVRHLRQQLGILPHVKQIDTLAGEYPARTNYLYLTYHATSDDLPPTTDHRSVIVLGSGAYRIGSSVEFDWCGVSALNTIRTLGYRPVMINYNPETVSTDYDSCDRLYFEELTLEHILDIVQHEHPHGLILSTGGQIPNNLATQLHQQHVPILGTSPLSIDRAEDRQKFSAMCDALHIDQPRWSQLTTIDDIHRFADRVGFPLLVRPSYVLSGAAMHVITNHDELTRFLARTADISPDHPVVVSQFIERAKEIELDAVASQGDIKAYAISEHVEFAGVHSGDATIVFPAQKLYVETIRRVKRVARAIARELHITGPFNIQFLARDNDIKVIECNLRASRSFPFVSKVLKHNLIDMATRAMLGQDIPTLSRSAFDLDYVGVKASQFSFARLLKADPILGVDMASTGEVGCLGDTFPEALLKSMLSVGHRIPRRGILISSGTTHSKADLLDAVRLLHVHGYTLYATAGTARYLANADIPTTLLHWPDENTQPNILDHLRNGSIDLVINIPKNHTSRELSNGYRVRRTAIDFNIPLITNARLASAYIHAFCTLPLTSLSIKSWDEYPTPS